MATATETEHSSADAAGGATYGGAIVVARREYRCECGHTLRFSGGGRHRVYFELTDATLEQPVMDRACPRCGRGLPGKNPP